MHKTTDGADQLVDRLQQSGLKRTPFRLRLLQIFKAARKPLTAAQILEALSKAKATRASFDRATVFRNLKTLVEAGLVNSTEFGTGATFYCLSHSESHHHHVFCQKCKTVEPLSICGIGAMVEQAKKLGFFVTEHRLELLGLCANCR
jgi:Fur family ferric uptake transcriptional regulator